MASPEVSPAYEDSEKAALIMATTEEQDCNDHDAATKDEPQDTATDYTTYSTQGLYGIFEASVRQHPDRGTKAELRLDLFAMEILLDLVIAIALMIFMYNAYRLVAEEYATNSHKSGSHGAMSVQCTCNFSRTIPDIRSFQR